MFTCKLIVQRRLEATGDVTYRNSYRLRSIGNADSIQQDVLLQTLTVRETLRSAAGLRLPHPTTREERRNNVECHPGARLEGVRKSQAGKQNPSGVLRAREEEAFFGYTNAIDFVHPFL